MPQIDVTDVLIDADVAGEAFQVIRRLEAVSNAGIGVLSSYIIPAIGNVQPTGDNALVREEGWSIENKTIEVYTIFPLRGVSEVAPGPLGVPVTWQADLVLWENTYFLVKVLDDFSQYGKGWVKATCDSFDFNGPPPMPARLVYGKMDFSNPQTGVGGTTPSH